MGEETKMEKNRKIRKKKKKKRQREKERSDSCAFVKSWTAIPMETVSAFQGKYMHRIYIYIYPIFFFFLPEKVKRLRFKQIGNPTTARIQVAKKHNDHHNQILLSTF